MIRATIAIKSFTRETLVVLRLAVSDGFGFFTLIQAARTTFMNA